MTLCTSRSKNGQIKENNLENISLNGCSKCIVSENYASLDGGVCKYCRTIRNDSEILSEEQNLSEMERELEEILKNHEGRGRGKYDALIMFSGGKDSTLLIHRLRKEYSGLRRFDSQ